MGVEELIIAMQGVVAAGAITSSSKLNMRNSNDAEDSIALSWRLRGAGKPTCHISVLIFRARYRTHSFFPDSRCI